MRLLKPARLVGIILAISLSCILGIFLLAFAITKVEPAFKTIPPGFDGTAPIVGDLAPEFTLRDIDGKEYRFAEHLGKRPIVIEFGSFSCPLCTNQLGMMRRVAEKHKEAVDFVFIYCREAHAGNAPAINSWKERKERACEVRKRLGSSMVILVDEFDDRSVQKRYGALENSGYVIDPEGRIARKLAIAQPMVLERWFQ